MSAPAPLRGDEAAAAAGVDPYRSRTRLWAERTGRLEPHVYPEAELWQELLGPTVVREARERHGAGIASKRPATLHTDWPFIAGAELVQLDHDGRLGLLLVKLAGSRRSSAWDDGALPAEYLLEAQHELAVSGHAFVLVAALLGGQMLELRTVERDERLLELLRGAEGDFYRYLEEDVPPPADGHEDAGEVLRELYPLAEPGRAVELGDAGRRLLERRRAITAAIARAELQRETVDQELKAAMREAELGLLDGAAAVRWSTVESRRLDTKALRASHPKIAARHETTSTTRRFSVL